ncbi:uncharacterized protein [Amphiura filiformis]|uniref:uncharacterized protein n=1 Tax=Amphiura filiformis TaxID=82378 RepID=UPI003B2274B5
MTTIKFRTEYGVTYLNPALPLKKRDSTNLLQKDNDWEFLMDEEHKQFYGFVNRLATQNSNLECEKLYVSHDRLCWHAVLRNIYTSSCSSKGTLCICFVQFYQTKIRHLSLVGGHDLNETIRRMMRKLGTNNVWSSYKACMKNHPQAKEVEIEKGLGDYLKRTSNLPGGKKYKKAGNVDVAVPVGELEDDERGENERVPQQEEEEQD